jgi:hypothetical protein
VESGESTKHWERLRKAGGDFTKTNRQIQDTIRAQQEEQNKPIDQQSMAKLSRLDEKIAAGRKSVSEQLATILKMIAEGANEQERWQEAMDLSHQIAVLKRAESSRVAEMGQTMTAMQAITLVTALHSIIAQRVTDQKTKQMIAMDLTRLMSSPAAGLGSAAGAASFGAGEDVVEGVVRPAAPPAAGPNEVGNADQ